MLHNDQYYITYLVFDMYNQHVHKDYVTLYIMYVYLYKFRFDDTKHSFMHPHILPGL